MRKLIVVVVFFASTVAALAQPNDALRTGVRGTDLIKRFEGLRLRAYRCPAGVLTIGYGHTGGVREGQVITAEIAQVYLLKDLRRFEKHTSANVTRRALRQNQFDACISLCYNAGYRIRGNLARSLNMNDTEGVAREFRKIVHAKGKKLAGLVRRREAEIKLYEEEQQ